MVPRVHSFHQQTDRGAETLVLMLDGGDDIIKADTLSCDVITETEAEVTSQPRPVVTAAALPECVCV